MGPHILECIKLKIWEAIIPPSFEKNHNVIFFLKHVMHTWIFWIKILNSNNHRVCQQLMLPCMVNLP
jgi:hypothetical protein